MREVHRYQRIPRIDTGRNRSYREAIRQFGRQVLQAMHSKVNSAFGESLFNFLGEHALGADLPERNVLQPVASGTDDFNGYFVPCRAEGIRDVVGLPERKLRSSGTDPNHE